MTNVAKKFGVDPVKENLVRACFMFYKKHSFDLGTLEYEIAQLTGEYSSSDRSLVERLISHFIVNGVE